MQCFLLILWKVPRHRGKHGIRRHFIFKLSNGYAIDEKIVIPHLTIGKNGDGLMTGPEGAPNLCLSIRGAKKKGSCAPKKCL